MSDQESQLYNPLDRTRLGESIVTALLKQPCRPLPPDKPFQGVGIYALYYQGGFPAYEPISSPGCDTPIYVGKAEPRGRRTGLQQPEALSSRRLYGRLTQHARSVNLASNLRLQDFRCRYLLVEDLWIPLGETLLIGRFRPLWNVVVEGFGLNAPGRRRHGGERSDWDELHPGRPWRDQMVQKRQPEEIIEEIRAHLEERAG